MDESSLGRTDLIKNISKELTHILYNKFEKNNILKLKKTVNEFIDNVIKGNFVDNLSEFTIIKKSDFRVIRAVKQDTLISVIAIHGYLIINETEHEIFIERSEPNLFTDVLEISIDRCVDMDTFQPYIKLTDKATKIKYDLSFGEILELKTKKDNLINFILQSINSTAFKDLNQED